MSKKDKANGFDAQKAKADKLALTVHDLVNGKFSLATRIQMKDFDREWTGGFYAMRVSMRGMPLFLVRYVVSAQEDQVDVFTEAEIQDGYRNNPCSTFWRMLMHGRNELMAKYERAA